MWEMQYDLSGDHRRAQTLLLSGAGGAADAHTFGRHEMSGRGASAAGERNLLFICGGRHTSSSEPRGAGCVRRLLEMVCRVMPRLAPSVALLALLVAPIGAQAQTTLGTQTLYVTLNAAAYLYSVPATTTLTTTGTAFNVSGFTGSTAMTYRARTGTSVTTAGITVKATADFTPTGQGLSIGTSGGPLTYTCSGTSGNGFTPCSGTLTVSTSTATNVVTISASACTGTGITNPCSGGNPDTVTVSFILANKPSYKTGPYSAILTFTISAT
jgi:hypothetical protein